MNWLDIVILITIVVGVWRGVKTGIIGTAIIAVGGLVGWMVAGRVSDDIGGIFDSVASDTIVTTASYVVVIAAAILASIYIAKIVRPALTAATLGLSAAADKIGGLVLGLLCGLVVSATLIVAIARLTYDFEPPDAGPVSEVPVDVDEAAPGGYAGGVGRRPGVRGRLGHAAGQRPRLRAFRLQSLA